MFITALTSFRHLSLSLASPIQSIYPHPTSWSSILILSTHLRLGLHSGLFPPVSPLRPYTPPSPHPYAPHAQPISFFLILSPAQYWVWSTNHLAPRYAIASIPPILRKYIIKVKFRCDIYIFSIKCNNKIALPVGFKICYWYLVVMFRGWGVLCMVIVDSPWWQWNWNGSRLTFLCFVVICTRR